jgi:hypothetical protein
VFCCILGVYIISSEIICTGLRDNEKYLHPLLDPFRLGRFSSLNNTLIMQLLFICMFLFDLALT